MEVGEQKVEVPKNSRLNQYNAMGVLKSATEEGLVEMITSHDGQLFVKAIYYSPTSNMHVAYVLSNELINKEL